MYSDVDPDADQIIWKMETVNNVINIIRHLGGNTSLKSHRFYCFNFRETLQIQAKGFSVQGKF